MAMQRREFLSRIAAGAICASGSLIYRTMPTIAELGQPAAGSKPNIVIIVADDLGWNDAGYHGSEIVTPHIDGLARDGIELNRFYSCPLCSPTRAGLMTGRYPIRFGMQRTVVRPWEKLGMPPEEELLPEMLARAGYERRGVFGKWHLGHSARKYHPLNQGFTHFYGHYNGFVDYFSHVRDGELDWHRGYAASHDEGYATDLVADEAARFIQECADGKPFFLYVPFLAPHAPNQAPQLYLERYAHLDQPRLKHAAMITCMDDAVGRILQAIEDKGIAEETLVLFFSDNGGQVGAGASNDPLRGQKGRVSEGGIRVPAAIRWPSRLKGGRRMDAVTGYIDVFPTLARIAGVDEDTVKPVDGLDMLDVLRGEAPAPERELYFYLGSDKQEQLAVITPEWKLIRLGPTILRASYKDEAVVSLYRIGEDPNETTGLAADHPEVVGGLLGWLRRFRSLRPAQGVTPSVVPPKGWKPPKNWEIPGS